MTSSLADNHDLLSCAAPPAHKSTSKVNFHMTPGGSGATCNDQNCGANNAFYQPTDYSAQRYDSSPDAGIVINFSC